MTMLLRKHRQYSDNVFFFYQFNYDDDQLVWGLNSHLWLFSERKSDGNFTVDLTVLPQWLHKFQPSLRLLQMPLPWPHLISCFFFLSCHLVMFMQENVTGVVRDPSDFIPRLSLTVSPGKVGALIVCYLVRHGVGTEVMSWFTRSLKKPGAKRVVHC